MPITGAMGVSSEAGMKFYTNCEKIENGTVSPKMVQIPSSLDTSWIMTR